MAEDSLFDLHFIGKRELNRERRAVAQDKIAAAALERKNKREDIKFSQAQFDRLVEIGKNPSLTDAGRRAIRQKLRQTPQGQELVELGQQVHVNQAQQLAKQAVPSLFDSLSSGKVNINNLPESIQQADASLQQVADQPVNLFDFTNKKDTEAKIKASRLNELSPDDQKKVLFPALTPDARKEAFKRLDPKVQEEVVMGAGKSVINVNVDNTKFSELGKTVSSGVKKDIIQLDRDIGIISQMEKDFENKFLSIPGKVRTGFTKLLDDFEIPPAKTEAMLEKLGIVDKADKDLMNRRAAFMVSAFTILNEQIKATTGAAVREGEEGRLGAQTADPQQDSPSQFRAKMAAVKTIKIRQRKEKAILIKRGLEYNKENVEAMPINNIDAIYQKEVVGEPLSPVEDAKFKLNNVKDSTAKGNATIQNAPTAQTQPSTPQDKLQFDEISKTLPAGTLQPFLTSHPNTLQIMQILLAEEKMEVSDIPEFLKKISGQADGDVAANLKKMMGGQ